MAPCRMGAYHIMRTFYSRYFRGHGLKYLNILFPNGLYGSVGDTSHSYNDVGIFNMSGLQDLLFVVLEEYGNKHLPCVFG